MMNYQTKSLRTSQIFDAFSAASGNHLKFSRLSRDRRYTENRREQFRIKRQGHFSVFLVIAQERSAIINEAIK